MISGIGIDVVELERIEKIIETNRSFIVRVLTPKELEKFDTLKIKRQKEYLGGRFACKEAFAKAYGTGIGKVTFQDIEILSESNGQPIVTKSPFVGNVFVSITHTDQVAMAQVILEKNK
ncbi:holo-ACP synthase [Vagococcus vulneris]|uniref:Holo-[acyl-carrier-protein] synthase n=1 Tax=Vagococcus vulneris TaxID=1977869 RepID=A0A429ZXH3_9ENTE|nr:holo-ACP synthase [Vagococcus vulneris]RST98577.1 holo-ACP synthase [Vagococcus vulneris]